MGRGAAPGQPEDRPAGTRVPVGRAKTDEGGHEHDAAAVVDGTAEPLDRRGVGDETEAVAQPLDRGAGHEDRALDGVNQMCVRTEPPGHGGEQAVARDDGVLAGVVAACWSPAAAAIGIARPKIDGSVAA